MLQRLGFIDRYGVGLLKEAFGFFEISDGECILRKQRQAFHPAPRVC